MCGQDGESSGEEADKDDKSQLGMGGLGSHSNRMSEFLSHDHWGPAVIRNGTTAVPTCHQIALARSPAAACPS